MIIETKGVIWWIIIAYGQGRGFWTLILMRVGKLSEVFVKKYKNFVNIDSFCKKNNILLEIYYYYGYWRVLA
jgi:hypothetical protein